MNEITMKEMLCVMEGTKIPTAEVIHRIKKVANKQGLDPEPIIQQWETINGGQKVHDVKSVNKILKKMGHGVKVSSKKVKGISPAIQQMSELVRKHKLEKAVVYLIDYLGLRTMRGKAAAGLDKLNPFTEDLMESEMDEESLAGLLRSLEDEFGAVEEGNGDLLDRPLDNIKLNTIIGLIDGNNIGGELDVIRGSIMSKWNDRSVDTRTLRGIGDEILSLSKKGLDV